MYYKICDQKPTKKWVKREIIVKNMAHIDKKNAQYIKKIFDNDATSSDVQDFSLHIFSVILLCLLKHPYIFMSRRLLAKK